MAIAITSILSQMYRWRRMADPFPDRYFARVEKLFQIALLPSRNR
jgi:hypothetical protein